MKLIIYMTLFLSLICAGLSNNVFAEKSAFNCELPVEVYMNEGNPHPCIVGSFTENWVQSQKGIGEKYKEKNQTCNDQPCSSSYKYYTDCRSIKSVVENGVNKNHCGLIYDFYYSMYYEGITDGPKDWSLIMFQNPSYTNNPELSGDEDITNKKEDLRGFDVAVTINEATKITSGKNIIIAGYAVATPNNDNDICIGDPNDNFMCVDALHWVSDSSGQKAVDIEWEKLLFRNLVHTEADGYDLLDNPFDLDSWNNGKKVSILSYKNDDDVLIPTQDGTPSGTFAIINIDTKRKEPAYIVESGAILVVRDQKYKVNGLNASFATVKNGGILILSNVFIERAKENTNPVITVEAGGKVYFTDLFDASSFSPKTYVSGYNDAPMIKFNSLSDMDPPWPYASKWTDDKKKFVYINDTDSNANNIGPLNFVIKRQSQDHPVIASAELSKAASCKITSLKNPYCEIDCKELENLDCETDCNAAEDPDCKAYCKEFKSLPHPDDHGWALVPDGQWGYKKQFLSPFTKGKKCFLKWIPFDEELELKGETVVLPPQPIEPDDMDKLQLYYNKKMVKVSVCDPGQYIKKDAGGNYSCADKPEGTGWVFNKETGEYTCKGLLDGTICRVNGCPYGAVKTGNDTACLCPEGSELISPNDKDYICIKSCTPPMANKLKTTGVTNEILFIKIAAMLGNDPPQDNPTTKDIFAKLKENDTCACPEGLTNVGDKCIDTAVEDGSCTEKNVSAIHGKWTYNSTNNACSFACDSGFLPGSDGVCKRSCSGNGMTPNSGQTACVCDTANHWVPNGSGCKCQDGYEAPNGICVAVGPVEPDECSADSECDDDEICKVGECQKEEPQPLNGECNANGDCGTGMICSSKNTCECDIDNRWKYNSATGVCKYDEEEALEAICKLSGGEYLESSCLHDKTQITCLKSEGKWETDVCWHDLDGDGIWTPDVDLPENKSGGSGCGTISNASLPESLGSILPYLIVLGIALSFPRKRESSEHHPCHSEPARGGRRIP